MRIPWSEVKKRGIYAFDEETKKEAENLLQELKKIGIFLVPVGELEGWIDFGTRDKKKWILQALPMIHEGKALEQLQNFVREILTYLSISASNQNSPIF